MTASAATLRVGWCPGALRPMASGDGLIVRFKPHGGTLTPGQGIGIAAAAARFGNGALDLTARANLQIRGATDATLAALTAALDAFGLLDVSPEAEARRNVVVSPLAGLDPTAAFDIRPAVRALEARLAAADSLAELPAKFGFAVSDGGAWSLDDVPADVRFEAGLDEARPAFAIRLDGDATTIALCSVEAMPTAAVRLARVLVDAGHNRSDLRRLRDLVAMMGAAAVFGAAGLEAERRRAVSPASAAAPPCIGFLSARHDECGGGQGYGFHDPAAPAFSPPGRRSSEGPDEGSRDAPAGPLSGAECRTLALGIGAPFGRFDAVQLDGLARAAAAAGATELRLAPWRAILVPGLDAVAAAELARACAAAGLIVDPADPRLRVAACTGAPGCRRGTTPTLVDAADWAPSLPPGRGIALHVSGCTKGCAHAGSALLTLVARDGRYDAVVAGRAGDAPSVTGLDGPAARRLVRTVLQDRAP